MENKPNGKIAEMPKPQNECSVGIVADKDRNVVRMQFEKPISWIEFNPIACADVMRFLGQKLKELSQ